MMGLALVVGLTILAIAVYFAYAILSGFLLVRGAPREDMFICQKGHGPLPKSALIRFMGEEYCSICFHQKMKQAERGELG